MCDVSETGTDVLCQVSGLPERGMLYLMFHVAARGAVCGNVCRGTTIVGNWGTSVVAPTGHAGFVSVEAGFRLEELDGTVVVRGRIPLPLLPGRPLHMVFAEMVGHAVETVLGLYNKDPSSIRYNRFEQDLGNDGGQIVFSPQSLLDQNRFVRRHG